MAVAEETFSNLGRSFGDEEGKFWRFGPFTSSFDLSTIRVWYGSVGIYGLQFQYELKSGNRWSPIYGLNAGVLAEVHLDKNVLAQIEVSIGEKPAIINSIAFVNDKGDRFGPYGKVTKDRKDITVEGSVAGFYGFAGDHIDALGIYDKPNLN